MNTRREFITLLGGAAAAWPIAARAQNAKPLIGHLSAVMLSSDRITEFHRGLHDFGFVENQNVAIQLRSAEGQFDRLPSLAAGLVDAKVDVIFTSGSTVAVQAAKAVTRTIPIVFIVGVDPVAAGLVDSLSRPGGNATGATSFNSTLGQKRLELLHEVVPNLRKVGLLVNSKNPMTSKDDAQSAQLAASRLGIEIVSLDGSTESKIETAFASAVQHSAAAIQVGADAFFISRSRQIADLSLRYRLPTIASTRDTVLAGQLMGYGATVAGGPYWQVGGYVGRILKGTKPSDLPVLQPTKFELVINLKSAKVLGLTIPESFLLLRADEVIE